MSAETNAFVVCSSVRSASVGALGVIWVPTFGGFTMPVVTASDMRSSGGLESSQGIVKSGASQRTMDEGSSKRWMRASRLLAED